MQNTRLIFIFVLLTASLVGKAQGNETILEYISTYKEMAIAEMQRTGVPASIKLAQGIHETTAGTSELVRKSNNHFGIKCKANWSGPSVSHDDDLRGECFRKYEDPMDSYKDHSDFLKGSSRYASLFQLDPMDYEDWAYGLKKAGYATNPKYPQIIIKLIENYHLQDYTLIAMGKMQLGEETIAKNMPPSAKPQTTSAVISEATITPVSIAKKEKPNYPSGEFRINETRVIFARKNTPVLLIAQEYNVALKKLFEFNEMYETEELQKDQLVYLQRKRKTGANEFHTVQPGETLEDIAMIEGIRMESLLDYNYLGANTRPAVGEQLYLHKKAPAMPKLETRIATNKGTIE